VHTGQHGAQNRAHETHVMPEARPRTGSFPYQAHPQADDEVLLLSQAMRANHLHSFDTADSATAPWPANEACRLVAFFPLSAFEGNASCVLAALLRAKTLHHMKHVMRILIQQSIPGSSMVEFVLVAREILVQFQCWGDAPFFCFFASHSRPGRAAGL
jgi:hypothetical protein